ncbi:MAG TPA: hypothetical protein VFI13_06775, partial [Gemmatimonadales bacterium]|nr:hypothetical protein [Gemmatimonadales bacterium]
SGRASDLSVHPIMTASNRATIAWKRVLTSLFLSSGAMAALLVLTGCDPGTTRPDVTPLPGAQQIEVLLDRGPAITLLRDALVADSFPVTRFDARDGWLEGPWVDARTRRPTSSQHLGPGVVRLRAWAEPARPGNSYLVVELAWRAMADPSLPQRTLERPLAPTDSMSLWLKGVLAVVDSAVGFHEPVGTKH